MPILKLLTNKIFKVGVNFLNMNYKYVAGASLFTGAVQFVLGLLIAEFLYPGYSTSANYISDLGATCDTSCIIYQQSAYIFNTSISLFGVSILLASYFIWCDSKNHLLFILFSITGIAIVGVGLFPKTTGIIHLIVSFITFFFGGLSAIATAKFIKDPFLYFSLVLGVISLTALTLFIFKIYLGLGPGGMERMIAYPLLLWVIGFGGNLMSPKM